ncbi:MAG: peptidylprolyl isomerase [Candidatus Brocadiia bacterium]
MATAQQGDTVKVHYKGTLEDGTVFDESAERGPLEFTIGEGEIIPGFEQAVVGMSPGETQSVSIAAAQAYGPHNEQLVGQIERTDLPDDLEPEIGQRLEMRSEEGQPFVVQITEVGEETVTLDGNHPLAGEDLNFQIELLEIE